MGKLAFGRAEKGGACPPLSRALFKKIVKRNYCGTRLLH